jgi:hypothetical protein
MIRYCLACIVLLLFASVHGVSAQEPTPEPGPNASKMLPAASDLGKSWKQFQVSGLDASADIFREAAVASYGGPRGSHIVVYVYLVTESRVAVRQSWEAASDLFDQYRYRLDYSYERDDQLQNLPAPEGCVEAKRTDGQDHDFYMPGAATLCAADPDIIVLAVVIGGIDGIADYGISDWVAGITATGSNLPRPTAPAPDETGG